MRHKEIEITDPKEVEAVLLASPILYLAMSRDGEPYCLPLNFGYADGRIYIHSSPKGRKAATLRANPKVAFSLCAEFSLITGDTACKFSCAYKSVAGTGTARFLENQEDKLQGLAVIMDHYADKQYPVDPRVLAKTEVIEITVEHMTGQHKRPKP